MCSLAVNGGLAQIRLRKYLQIRVVAGVDAVLVIIDALKIQRLFNQFFILFQVCVCVCVCMRVR